MRRTARGSGRGGRGEWGVGGRGRWGGREGHLDGLDEHRLAAQAVAVGLLQLAAGGGQVPGVQVGGGGGGGRVGRGEEGGVQQHADLVVLCGQRRVLHHLVHRGRQHSRQVRPQLLGGPHAPHLQPPLRLRHGGQHRTAMGLPPAAVAAAARPAALLLVRIVILVINHRLLLLLLAVLIITFIIVGVRVVLVTSMLLVIVICYTVLGALVSSRQLGQATPGSARNDEHLANQDLVFGNAKQRSHAGLDLGLEIGKLRRIVEDSLGVLVEGKLEDGQLQREPRGQWWRGRGWRRRQRRLRWR